MPRRPRVTPGDLVYHVLNRAVARLPLFQKRADYEAFERVLALAAERHPLRVLAYSLMPNHWHMVLWPRQNGQLTAFLRWLTHTHTMRCQAHTARRLGLEFTLRPRGRPRKPVTERTTSKK